MSGLQGALYKIDRTRTEVAVSVAIGLMLLYKVAKLPTVDASTPRGILQYRRMQVCQRAAAWFGQQAMRAELAYRREVES